ncbi:GNAT family N-acetyltransferase [Halobacillus campisalis]|uniref:GNAT family N-acetyltransferase n=1 Tax=Halobacillus campisalis TaxID=435909 RepID=A0ABW2K7K5_9BACI|nr:GNAT family protein [Halobacillus campisalis]
MIKLEYFTQSDFDHLIGWIDSPEFLLQWAGPNFTYPLTTDQLMHYIGNANTKNAPVFVYKVVDEAVDQTIGHISLKIDRQNKAGRIGKVLVSEEARGKGIAGVMIEKILYKCFAELHLHKVGLGVFDFNEPAIRVYKKAGFKVDGLLRDHRKYNNEYWGLYEMSMLHSEWKAKNIF